MPFFFLEKPFGYEVVWVFVDSGMPMQGEDHCKRYGASWYGELTNFHVLVNVPSNHWNRRVQTHRFLQANIFHIEQGFEWSIDTHIYVVLKSNILAEQI
ncbi:unnamed protein product [Ixodes persulcatus]